MTRLEMRVFAHIVVKENPGRCDSPPGLNIPSWLAPMAYQIPTATRKPSAEIIQFPLSRRRADIRVEAENDGLGWVVLAPNGHGWAHGLWSAAINDARAIARGFGTGVTSSAGRFVP